MQLTAFEVLLIVGLALSVWYNLQTAQQRQAQTDRRLDTLETTVRKLEWEWENLDEDDDDGGGGERRPAPSLKEVPKIGKTGT